MPTGKSNEKVAKMFQEHVIRMGRQTMGISYDVCEFESCTREVKALIQWFFNERREFFFKRVKSSG